MHDRLLIVPLPPCLALLCYAPCPALPCPAQPCPAQPSPAQPAGQTPSVRAQAGLTPPKHSIAGMLIMWAQHLSHMAAYLHPPSASRRTTLSPLFIILRRNLPNQSVLHSPAAAAAAAASPLLPLALSSFRSLTLSLSLSLALPLHLRILSRTAFALMSGLG